MRADFGLTRIKRRIFEVVSRSPGISADEIANVVYADRINGGPEGGRKTIHVHIHQINRFLRQSGVVIRGTKFTGYRVITKKGEGTWETK